MAKIIAIDRTEQQLRYVLADVRPRGLMSILASGSFGVTGDDDAVQQLGRQLRQVLVEHKATKARLLVGLGRGALESVEFTVPSVEDALLPSMVRNLAMRHLSSITEDTPLDFLTGPLRSDGSRSVEAMTVRDDVQRQLDAFTQAAEMPAARILVRPHELRVFARDDEVESLVVLLVSSSAHTADVLLLHPEGWRLARSIRVAESSSPSASAAQVVNEIRRTLFSLPLEDFDATHIDRIVLLAGPDELSHLATELGTALDAPVRRQDPFADARLRNKATVEGVSEFAPLVGMLLNESGGQHPVDFRNPRQPPRPVNRRKVAVAGVAAIAALVAGAVYFVKGKFAEIDEQNRQLAARVRELKELAEEVEPRLRLANALQAWEDSRISWLDELRDLTLRMPSSRQLTVQRFSAAPSRSGDATITFSGVSRAPEFVTRMENSLRDEHHLPKTPGLREKAAQDASVWTFQTTLIVQARSPDEYTTHLTPASGDSVVTAFKRPAPVDADDADSEP